MKRRHFRAIVTSVLVGSGALLGGADAAAQITWTGAGGDGSWHTAANWDLARVPMAGDDVIIPAGGGTVTYSSAASTSVNSVQAERPVSMTDGALHLDSDSSFASLTMTYFLSGIYGPADITITGTLNLGGTIGGTGTLTLPVGAVASPLTTSARIDKTLESAGTINVPANTFLMLTNTNNSSSGTIHLQNTSSQLIGDGSAGLVNTGQIIRSGAGSSTIGRSSVELALTNNGTMDLQAGTLVLGGGGTNNGVITLGTGATLWHEHAGFVHSIESLIDGDGTVYIYSGSHTFQGPVTTPNLTMVSGSATFSDTDQTFANVTLNDFHPAIYGAADITITGTLNIGSTIGGTGTLTLTAGCVTTTSSQSGRIDKTLDNAGTVNIPGNTYLRLTAAGNTSSGTINILGNFSALNGATPETGISHLTNEGLLTRSGSGQSYIAIPGNQIRITNNGTIDVQAGLLHVMGGGASHGDIAIAAGATLNLDRFTMVHSAASSIAGGGTLGIGLHSRSGAFTFEGPVTVPTLSMLGGTATFNNGEQTFTHVFLDNFHPAIYGSADMTITDTLSIGSTIGGTGTLTLAAGCVTTPTGSLGQIDKTLDNAGTINIAGNTVLRLTAADSTSSGTINFLGDNSWLNGATPDGDTSHLTNEGLITRWGTGTSLIAAGGNRIQITNNGTIDVQTGILRVLGGGANNGDITIAAGATLELDRFSMVHSAASSITGGGTLSTSINYGVFTFEGPVTVHTVHIAGGTVTFNNGQQTFTNLIVGDFYPTVLGSADMTVTGTLSIGRLIGGTGKLTLTAGCVTTPTGQEGRIDKELENAGTINVGGGTTLRLGLVTHTNRGTINLQNYSALIGDPSGAAELVNEGLIRRSGTDVSFLASGGNLLTLTNNGTVEIQSGTLYMYAGGANNCTLRILAGATLTIDSASSFTHAGGVLEGSGTINGSVNNLGSSVRPGGSGAAGTLTITGNYTQSSVASLAIEVGGPVAGTQHDRLVVGGTATLNGAIDVTQLGGFNPAPTDSFTFLTAAARSGSFALVRPVAQSMNYGATAAAVSFSHATKVVSGYTDPVSIFSGQSIILSVPASSSDNAYQWRKGGSPLADGPTGGSSLSGATSASLTITNAATADAGTYDCAIASSCGDQTSPPVVLTVVNVDPPVATASYNVPVAEGQLLQLFGGPNGMAAYSWTGPSGFTSTQQSPIVSNVATEFHTGVYTLTVTDSIGRTASANVMVVVTGCASQWDPLAAGMNNTVFALTVFNGELIAGGQFSTAGGISANGIARWNGTTWQPLGSGLNNTVRALTVYNGELIAGGFFTTAGGVPANRIARWNGSIWQPLGNGIGANVVLALTVFNGELIAGGQFTSAGGASANRVARWDGSTWRPLGAGVNSDLFALGVYNSELVAGGRFTTAGGVAANRVARWDGTKWSPLGAGVNNIVRSFHSYNGELVVGGGFTTAGGAPALGIARWDGGNWNTLGSGMNSEVDALAIVHGELVAGGRFTIAGGTSANRIARWNGANWLPLGSGLGGVNNGVEALQTIGTELFAGGLFTTAGGSPANRIARRTCANSPPTATCPAPVDVDCTAPAGATVTLTATVADPDGDALTVIWRVDGNVVQTDNVPAGTPPTSATVTLTRVYSIGNHTLDLTVSDNAAQPAACHVEHVMVVDDEAPTVVCPVHAHDPVAAGANCQGAVPDITDEVHASDLCTPDGGITITQDPPAGSLVGLGTHTITVTARDGSNNSSTCEVQFDVTDQSPPDINACPPAEASSDADDACMAALPDFAGLVSASDNCSAAAALTITQSPAAGTPLGLGPHFVTIEIADEAGNVAACNVEFTVNDATPPDVTLNGADPLYVECSAGSFDDPGATALDACDPDVPVTSSGAIDISTTGTYVVAYDALDDSGNAATTLTRTVIVVPPVPVASAGPDQSVPEGSHVFLDASGTASPPCGALTYAWTQVAGTAVSLAGANSPSPAFFAPRVPRGGETLTFELVVTNEGRVSAPDVVNVTVTNVNHAPVAVAEGPAAVAEFGLAALDGSHSYDADDEPFTYTWTQMAGTPVTLDLMDPARPTFIAPPVGHAGETLTFELTVDDGLDSSSASLSLLVEDVNHVPIADAGADQTRAEGATVLLDASGSRDDDGDTLRYSWAQVSGPAVTLAGDDSATPSFTAPPVAVDTTLVFRVCVDDQYGGSACDEAAVTVQNSNSPPQCGLARPSVAELWPPNHKMVAVSILGVTDPENNAVQVAILNVTQDEPINGLGDGDTSPDAVIQGSTVLLRAERAGNRPGGGGPGNGRVYRVTFVADDGFGGTCTGTVKVCVPHSKGRNALPCVDDGQNYNSLGP